MLFQLNVLTIIGYIVLGLWQWQRFKIKKVIDSILLLRLATVILLMCHAIVLYYAIDINGGQNLAVLNILSMVVWFVGVLIFVCSLSRPLDSLAIFTHPLAAITMLLAWIFPSDNLLNTRQHLNELIHILLSIVTFSVICLAGVQALLVAIVEHLLRSKQTNGLLQALPPLQALESLLFQMIAFGFIMLSADIILSFATFGMLMQGLLFQKAILSIAAWLVFAALLAGRYFGGWRGTKAIRWTFVGVFMVLLCSLFLAIR